MNKQTDDNRRDSYLEGVIEVQMIKEAPKSLNEMSVGWSDTYSTAGYHESRENSSTDETRKVHKPLSTKRGRLLSPISDHHSGAARSGTA